MPDSDSTHASATQPLDSPVGSRFLLTTVSAIAFCIAGVLIWSPQFVLLLFAVLFLHEAGHFAAMKALGYRDVRLFFVPLLGAAVAGRPQSRSELKSVIVTLAGPLPGIVIATALWLSGLCNTSSVVRLTVLMLLTINGLNLLPLYPLDGSQLLRTIFGQRLPWMEEATRVASVLSLLVLAYVLGSWLPLIVVFFFLVSLRRLWHERRIRHRLSQRQQEGAPVNESDILEAVQQEYPGAQLTEATATAWLRHFENKSSMKPLSSVEAAVVILIAVSALIVSASITWQLVGSPPSLEAPVLMPGTDSLKGR